MACRAQPAAQHGHRVRDVGGEGRDAHGEQRRIRDQRGNPAGSADDPGYETRHPEKQADEYDMGHASIFPACVIALSWYTRRAALLRSNAVS
jgi:hypothetical protein